MKPVLPRMCLDGFRCIIPNGLLALLVASGSWHVQVQAQESAIDYKPLVMPVQKGDALVIQGQVGQVRLKAVRSPQLVVKVRQSQAKNLPSSLKGSIDEWNFTMQRNDRKIVMSVQGPSDRQVWREWHRTGSVPRFDLDIESPAIPVELTLQEGQVVIDAWSENLKLTNLKGSVSVLGGAGDVAVFGQETDVTVQQRTGRVSVETFQGKLQLRGIKGRMSAENFAGELLVDNGEGPLALFTNQGQLSVNGGRGQIEYVLGRGSLRITNFEGNLRGKADQGSVTAKLRRPTEVKVSALEGAINLDLGDSGAALNLSSKDGAVTGPAHLKSEMLGGRRVLRGRMRGANDGYVQVRTESGSIRVR